MSRLIDAYALIEDCKRYLGTLNPDRDGKECTRIHWLIGVLENAPTIEQERQKGVWIVLKHSHNAMRSNCHRKFVDAYDLDNWDNYCRHCGAVMESIVAEEEWDWNTQNT